MPKQQLVWCDYLIPFLLLAKSKMMRASLTRFATMIAGCAAHPPKADEPVTLANSSFLVSPDRLTREFERLMSGHTHIFLKGSVHEGKSSWAQSYAQLNPTTACYIPCNEGVGGVEKICECIVKYYNKHVCDNCNESGPPKTKHGNSLPLIEDPFDLTALPQDFTLLFDECHELFSLPWDSAPFAYFVKRTLLDCRVVYLSTTQYLTLKSTPAQVDNKWILPWRFTREEVAKLIPCMLHGQLDPPSKVDDATADLLFGLLKGHRGMTMTTLEAIRQRQVVDGVPAVDLSFGAIHRELCSIFSKHEGPYRSRAATIVGAGRTSFPHGYGHNMEVLTQCALASGKIAKEISWRTPGDILHGMAIGAFSPLEMCGGYDKATKVVDSPDYAISNPLLRNNLEQSMGPRPFCTVDLPELPVDAIVTAFACMPDNLFLKCGGSCTTRKSVVWYADSINEAIRASFNRVYNLTTSMVVGAPTSAEGVAKVGHVCGNFRIENVVYENASQVASHYRRWHDVAEYKAGLAAKHPSLLVVCCRPDQAGEVKEIVKCSLFGERSLPRSGPSAFDPVFSSFNELVPVLIVEIDWSLLWQFSVTYMEKIRNDNDNPATREATAVIPRNLLPWKFDATTRNFVPASSPSATLQSELDGLKQSVPEEPVRVRVLISREPGKYDTLLEESDVQSDVRPVLNRYNLGDSVEAIRRAVKAYILQGKLRQYDVCHLRVYPPGTTEFVSKNEYGADGGPGPISTSLFPTKKDPYVIVAVNPRLFFPVRVRVLISRQLGKYDTVLRESDAQSDVRPVLNQYTLGDTVDQMRYAVMDYVLRAVLHEYDVDDLRVYPPGTTEFVSKNQYGADGGPGPISTPLAPTAKDPYVIVAMNPKLFPVRVRVLISRQPGKYDTLLGEGDVQSDVRPVLSQYNLGGTVDAMRRAVKAYVLQSKLREYSLDDLKVYPPGTTEFVSKNQYGADDGAGPISAPLFSTTKDPYVIVAVNPKLLPVRVRVLISREPGKYDTLLGETDVRPVLHQYDLFGTVYELRYAVKDYILRDELREYDVDDLRVYPPGTTRFVREFVYGADGFSGPISTPLAPTTNDPYVIVVMGQYFVSGDGSIFCVIPKQHVVWALKQAIKPHWDAVDAAKIIIKSTHDGPALGDTDPLHEGAQYFFEFPTLLS